jgi:hypothetical protein
MTDSSIHPTLTLVLSLADIAIKLAAVLIGGWWTLWNYRKSRTYEQKLELELDSTVFVKKDLYGDVRLIIRNIGATKHTVQHSGTNFELFTVDEDLSEESAGLFRVFEGNRIIEPGESINDTFCWKIQRPLEGILWIKLSLRVVSDGVEWWSTRMIRIDSEQVTPSNEVI